MLAKKRYWSVQELVVIGVFAASTKVSTLIVALAGGGMNPVTLIIKNIIFTTMIIVMLYKIHKSGTLILFVTVNLLISMMLLGTSITTLPSIYIAAILAEIAILLTGGAAKPWAPVLAVAIYDLVSRVISLAISFYFMRENPAMVYMVLPILAIGYIGAIIGLFSGVKAVKELRHAGIIRT